MENRISGRCAIVVVSLLLAGAASAKPLVWWTMANDAADGSLGGSLFVGTHKGVNGLWWVIQRGAMIIIR